MISDQTAATMEQTVAAENNSPVAGRGRRTAWNVAGQETTAATPPIMGGAATWPSLSSNRFSPKSSMTPSSSSDDLKSMSDGSSSAVSASVIQKSAASPESVLVQAAAAAATPPPQPKPTSNPNPNPNPATNRHNPNPNNRSSNKWHNNNNNNNNNNNRRNNYNNNYNNNFRPREKGPNWNNNNNNNNNWNSNNNNNNNNGNNSLHQRPQNFYRPNPAVAAPPVSFGFAAPPVHQAFYPPMGFAEYPFQVMSPVPLMAPQFMPQIPMVLSTGEVERRNAILTQIEYYFSTENLCKDVYLRKNMDEQGWVPISLIAGFNRVKQLTTDMQYILDVIQGSLILEVQGDKIRSRNNWMNWVFTERMQGLNINTTPLTTAHNIIL